MPKKRKILASKNSFQLGARKIAKNAAVVSMESEDHHFIRTKNTKKL